MGVVNVMTSSNNAVASTSSTPRISSTLTVTLVTTTTVHVGYAPTSTNDCAAQSTTYITVYGQTAATKHAATSGTTTTVLVDGVTASSSATAVPSSPYLGTQQNSTAYARNSTTFVHTGTLRSNYTAPTSPPIPIQSDGGAVVPCISMMALAFVMAVALYL